MHNGHPSSHPNSLPGLLPGKFLPLLTKVWAFFGKVWAFFGKVWAFSGKVWAFSGKVWAFFGKVWAFFGKVCAFFGKVWAFSGKVWAFFGKVWAFSSMEYQRKTKRSISFSFVDNKLYCTIPQYNDLFEPTLFKPFNFEFVMENYTPLKLYTDLVEDLNLNLQIWSKE